MPIPADPKESETRFKDLSTAGPTDEGAIIPTASWTNDPNRIGEEGVTYRTPEGENWLRDQQGLLVNVGAGSAGSRSGKTLYAPGAETGLPISDVRLGMNPQGNWTEQKMRSLFPEMFLQLPELPEDYAQRTPEERIKALDVAQGKLGAEMKRVGIDPRSLNPGELASDGQGSAYYNPRGSKWANRSQFEQHVMQQIGGNPFEMNPYKAVQKADLQLPALFNHLFQGQVAWNDLPKLDKDQRAYWEQAKKQFRREAFEKAKMEQANSLRQYKWMMDSFDLRAKMDQAEDDRILKEAKEAGKAPEHVNIVDDDGNTYLHVWNPKTGKFESTGLPTKMANGLDGYPKPPPIIARHMQIMNTLKPKKGNEMTQIFAMAMMAGESDPKRRAILEANPMMASIFGTDKGFDTPEHEEMYKRSFEAVLGWLRSITPMPTAAGTTDITKTAATTSPTPGAGPGAVSTVTQPGKTSGTASPKVLSYSPERGFVQE